MEEKTIFVYENWTESDPKLIGKLYVSYIRGKEQFSFEYETEWLTSQAANYLLDPDLLLYNGRHYVPMDKKLFGVFADSCPDRWGRLLMRRREAELARREDRKPKKLGESDYLLGVYDKARMGALRFKTEKNGLFLSDDQELATPPWTTLRTLEAASWGFENDESGLETKWLRQLLAPGSSLGGARPKATVKDEKGNLWIAKFPSKHVYALGQWIVKEQGEKRAKYGQYIIRKLSAALTEKYGRGFLEDTLKNARKFYLTYRDRISETTFSLFGDTLPFILSWSHYLILMRIERVMRLKWGKAICLKPDRNVLLLMRIRTIKIPIVDFSSSSFTYLS